jgi:hypothetical protein
MKKRLEVEYDNGELDIIECISKPLTSKWNMNKSITQPIKA